MTHAWTVALAWTWSTGSNVFARLDLMVPVVKRISTIACHNRAETMAFAMTQLPAIPANAHPVTLDFRAKQISTTVNHHHATEVHASMATIHSHVNAMQVTPVNCAKLKSMNANQVSNSKYRKPFLFKFRIKFLPIHFHSTRSMPIRRTLWRSCWRLSLPLQTRNIWRKLWNQCERMSFEWVKSPKFVALLFP